MATCSAFTLFAFCSLALATGVTPTVCPDGNSSAATCADECSVDLDCGEGAVCCSNGCANICHSGATSQGQGGGTEDMGMASSEVIATAMAGAFLVVAFCCCGMVFLTRRRNANASASTQEDGEREQKPEDGDVVTVSV